MEEGQFTQTMWIKKPLSKFQKSWIGRAFLVQSMYTIAYRCPNCKKIELYTEDVKENSK